MAKGPPNPRTKYGAVLKKKNIDERATYTRTQTGSGAHYVDLKTEHFYRPDRNESFKKKK